MFSHLQFTTLHLPTTMVKGGRGARASKTSTHCVKTTKLTHVCCNTTRRESEPPSPSDLLKTRPRTVENESPVHVVVVGGTSRNCFVAGQTRAKSYYCLEDNLPRTACCEGLRSNSSLDGTMQCRFPNYHAIKRSH